MTVGNDLTIYKKIENPLAFFSDSKMMAAASAMTGCSLDQAPAVLMTCMYEGISLLDYHRTYHTIKGRPTKRTDAMLAEFNDRLGGKHKILECTEKVSRVRFQMPGEEPEEWTLTIEEAISNDYCFENEKPKEGVNPKSVEPTTGRMWKDNWDGITKRADMLFNRNVSRALRKIAPTICAGIYTPEEIEDLDVAAPATIVTNEPKKSVSEIIAAKAEQPAVSTVVPATEPVEDVSDAEFTAAGEVPTTEPDHLAASAQTATGFATDEQVVRLNELREEMAKVANMSNEQWQTALQRRGASTVRGLSQSVASEMISKLEDKVKEARARSGASFQS